MDRFLTVRSAHVNCLILDRNIETSNSNVWGMALIYGGIAKLLTKNIFFFDFCVSYSMLSKGHILTHFLFHNLHIFFFCLIINQFMILVHSLTFFFSFLIIFYRNANLSFDMLAMFSVTSVIFDLTSTFY